jgi:hypothetical protein
MITWVRYAMRQKNEKNTILYIIPFLNVYPDTNNELTELQPEHKDILHGKTLCSNGIALFMQRGKDYWHNIKHQAFGSGAAKVHGNVGQKRGLEKSDPALYDYITEFFAGLEKLGEARATRSVRTMCGVSNRDEDDGKSVYLPSHMSIRNCYGRLLDELGFKIETFHDGSFTVEWIGEGDTANYPDLTTFYNIWKRDFGHIKVSPAYEDICEQCWKFSNRNKWMDNTDSVNSDADDALFVEDTFEDTGPRDDDEESDQEENGSNRDNNSANSQKSTANESAEKSASVSIDVDALVEDGNEDEKETPEQKKLRLRTESREQMILRANLHISMARAQRLLYVTLVHKARAHCLMNLPHNLRSYTFVVDYGQNMAVPTFNKEQPGCAYYFSPLNVYNLGKVNQAHVGQDGQPKNHLYAHVYDEGVGKKGENNVVSLIHKTLEGMGILKDDVIGGELNIIYDNCTGQNKNNTVLKYLVWLTEMGYFKQVNFIFLIVGHTKNAADRLFNALKKKYRKQNIYTLEELLSVLDESDTVTVMQSTPEDFCDWESYLDLFYRDYKMSGGGGLIKQNHMFSCNYQSNRVQNTLHVNIRESDLPEHAIVNHKSIKNGFFGRSNFAKNASGLRDAINARPAIMRDSLSDKLKVIECEGINIFKRVELSTKWKKIIPPEHRSNNLYELPPEHILQAVKNERSERKKFNYAIKEDKKKVQKMEPGLNNEEK